MPTRWPFAGRVEETDRLLTLMNDPDVRGVAIVGAAGAGKSRLAMEVVTSLRSRGRTAVHAIASMAARELPFGALAHLLPAALPQGANPLKWISDTLVGTERRPLILVDDAHLLDSGSAAVLHHMAQDAAAQLLLTLRGGEPVPDTLVSLWKDLGLVRMELAPLSLRDVGRILAAVLGDPVESASVARLHRLAGGNALFLRELVAGALDGGALVRVRGLWRLESAPPVAPALADLVAARIGRLEPAEEEALEYIALGEPLGAQLLAGLVPAATVESLEAKDLIRVLVDGRRTLVRLAHPLYGEAIRAGSPLLRTRRRYRRLAEALEAAGGRRRDDVVRLAVWRLESGTVKDPGPLLSGSEIAWAAHDATLATRLGWAALNAGGGARAAIMLSDVLSFSEAFTDSEAALTSVWNEPCGPELRAQLAMQRAWNLNFGLRRPAEADAVLDAAEAMLDDPSLRLLVHAMRLNVRILRGEVHESARAAEEMLAGEHLSVVAEAMALGITAYGLPYAGRCDEARRMCLRARAVEASWHDAAPSEVLKLIAGSYLAEMLSGDLAAAERAVRHGQEVLGDDSALRLFRRMFLQWHGEIARMRGRLAEAARITKEATTLAGAGHFTALAVAELAHCTALLGDQGTARALLAEAERDRTDVLYLLQTSIDAAQRWVTAMGGQLPRATELALAHAARARSQALLGIELGALHDVVRFGGARRVATRLTEVARRHDGALAAVCAAHAAAAASGDGEGLDRVAGSFRELGMTLHAAEAYAQASAAHHARGHPQKGRTAAARAAACAAACGGPRTPALARLRGPALTAREREIARLAAAGLASKEIAARLVLSIRTVDNHLQSVYGKLGVNGRTELTELLDADSPPEADD
ncbi:LuxR family transcriptional regulator [Nonomuraea africana]|uniref:DNA-binding CsgD family transcriptional regulator n=1 Tax=Nonomuraea africana TaxID=46171 RepID=A0ABR9KF51_9ACTN|nr:LuxR C-terminal-related transcriptional regulator [Nonomuraea africana]MBE1560646.1 DNA-binding CsgD family transcriptional regulator [Nonomuraea africana]